jgi:two-component system, cell cycle sensor histidine kinase and response regulator CckA
MQRGSPVTRASGNQAARGEISTPTGTATGRILVVDDEPAVREFVERVLTNAGYIVATASGGAHACGIIREHSEFDLIVADVRMPGMSGPEFIGRVREERPGMTVLYLTAYNDELFKERFALADNEAFLDKPSSVRGLLEAVSLLLCGHLPVAVP